MLRHCAGASRARQRAKSSLECPPASTPVTQSVTYRGRLTRVKPLSLVALLLACAAACPAAPGYRQGNDPALADTLKARIEAAYDFSRPGALDRMTGLYPDTGRVISASGGHVIASADSLRAGIATFWNNVGRNMRNARWVWG